MSETPQLTLVDRPPFSFSIAIRTVAARREMCGALLRRLAGRTAEDAAVGIFCHDGEGLTPNENALEALKLGIASGSEWVILLEDDVDVVDDFAGSVGRWLAAFATPAVRFYPLGAFYPHEIQASLARGAWDLPIKAYYGSQAVAMRRGDADLFVAWMSRVIAAKGREHVARALDIFLGRWHREVQPDQETVLTPAPCLVDHLGDVSVLGYENGTGPGRFLAFGGRGFVFGRDRPAAAPRRGWQPRMILNGDAVITTGFARATHKIAETLYKFYDLSVVGINYSGVPPNHGYPYPIYPANPGGRADAWGLELLHTLIPELRPHVVVVQQDPWNMVEYVRAFARSVPLVGFMPVDGRNCKDGAALNGLALGIFYTQFGLDEARAGGYDGRGAVVPLGVDLEIYRPADREAVRERMGLHRPGLDGQPKLPRGAFVVGNVNRNQPRKRLDLTIAYFAEWVKTRRIRDAYLYLHLAPTGDRGWDVKQLAGYYGIADRLITMSSLKPGVGVTEAQLATIYSAFDIQLTTTQGEGFGLPTLEGMACGVPQVAPDWSALGDWLDDGGVLVPCTATAATINGVNIIGGIPDREQTIAALDRLYRDRAATAALGLRARALAERPCYRWDRIGQAFHEAVYAALDDGLEVRWGAPGVPAALPSAPVAAPSASRAAGGGT